MSLDSELKGKITNSAWEKVGIHSHHGINIPLFSIHTENSCGIGEFFDLLPFIDWCAQLGMDIIQLLPLNVSGHDPSPYNAFSSCALHPIYLSLYALPYLNGMEAELKSLRSFNSKKHLNYHIVYKKKLSFLSIYLKKAKENLKKEAAFENFVLKHDWLPSYALFHILKDKYNHIHWKHWPEEVRAPSATHLKKLYAEYAHEMTYQFLIQYLCFQQLKKVKSYAESKGVFLKGDIPILVSPDSADAWHNPTFFDFNYVAGSPPSHLNPKGQYWGFPLYNWKAMEEDHYEWWKKRLLTAQELYHLYRIDHLIGFFHIWAIPIDQDPIKGFYLPKDPSIMYIQGCKILKTLVNFTNMLPIGEVLGQSFPFVYECLKDYGIPWIKIFRWERDWKHNQVFIPYENYDPISMSSVSTHDLDTVKLWWQKNPKEALDYAKFKGWTYTKELTPKHQFEILHDNHHNGSLFHINLLQEYLALVPELTWENPEDERINYPGTIQPLNWTYRYKFPLEKVTTHPKLNNQMKKILEA